MSLHQQKFSSASSARKARKEACLPEEPVNSGARKSRVERKHVLDSRGMPLPLYKSAYLNEDSAAGWHIVYSVLDPQSVAEGHPRYRRYRIKLNKYKHSYPTIRQMKQFAEGLVQQINVKLAGGWSPIGELQNARFYTPIEQVVEAYLKDKQGEVRHATYLSYVSVSGVFSAWCVKCLPGCQIIDFNRVHALEFMLYLRDERGVSNRTYNNYLKQLRLLMEWAVSHLYCKENAFKTIKARKREQKQRVVIPEDVRGMIREHLMHDAEGRAFWLFLEMVYVSLMRPMEIRRCKIEQLHPEEHYVHIPADQAKCWKARNCPLSDEQIELLKEYLDLHAHRPTDNLFSSYFRPGKTPVGVQAINERWAKVKRALHLPEQMKVYSLRDSRIVDLLHSGVDDLTVMQAAGHHDLSITSLYADHVDRSLIERVRNA